MNGSAQLNRGLKTPVSAFARDSRVNWIGSKLLHSLGIEPARMDAIHQAIALRALQAGNLARPAPENECDALAASIIEVARLAEHAAAISGPDAAISAVLRESGLSVDPLLAQNFARLASSPIFWMALDCKRYAGSLN